MVLVAGSAADGSHRGGSYFADLARVAWVVVWQRVDGC